jgi:peptide/nickel transport system substrate-binding protein
MNTIGSTGETEVVDDTHVVVHFDRPSYMDGPVMLGNVWIVPEHLWQDIEDPADDPVANPVGTGPYMLDEFAPQGFTLTANPDYYRGVPKVRNVRYLALSGNQAAADALAAGEVDWQTSPVPNMDNVSEAYPGYRGITVPMNQMVLTACANTELGCEGPQTDPAVREAIYYAINRTQINELAFQSTASEISPGFALRERDATYLSPDLQEPTASMEADVTQAERTLEDAGYTRGSDGIYAKDGQRVSLSVRVVEGWDDYISAIDIMRQQLGEVGIELTMDTSAYGQWGSARDSGDYELVIDSLFQGPDADPYYVYNYFFSSENTAPVGETAWPNASRYVNPEVDQAIEELRAIDPEDREARQPHYDTIQAAIERDMPYIPILTQGTTTEFNAEKFTGWPTEVNLYAFPAVWEKPDQAQVFMNLRPAP